MILYGNERWRKAMMSDYLKIVNQLNFTKIRISKKQTVMLLYDKEAEIKLIHTTDNFGDYGIIGFYVCRGNRLEYFVISCRIMNIAGYEPFKDFVQFKQVQYNKK